LDYPLWFPDKTSFFLYFLSLFFLLSRDARSYVRWFESLRKKSLRSKLPAAINMGLATGATDGLDGGGWWFLHSFAFCLHCIQGTGNGVESSFSFFSPLSLCTVAYVCATLTYLTLPGPEKLPQESGWVAGGEFSLCSMPVFFSLLFLFLFTLFSFCG